MSRMVPVTFEGNVVGYVNAVAADHIATMMVEAPTLELVVSCLAGFERDGVVAREIILTHPEAAPRFPKAD